MGAVNPPSPFIFGGSSNVGQTLLPPASTGYLKSDTSGNLSYGTGPAVVNYNTTQQTSNYSASMNDFVYIGSSSTLTVTLPAVTALNSGQVITVVSSAGPSNASPTVTINTTGQLINFNGTTFGSGALSLYTIDETFVFVSYWNGSTGLWFVQAHYANTSPASAGTISLSATSAYVFTIPSSSITAGTIYSHNGFLYTVSTTTVSSTSLACSGTGTPTTSGTLTFVSGSPSGNLSFSARTVTGVPAFGTTTTNAVTWWRIGKFAYVSIALGQTVAGTAGSGDYIFYLPFNIDTTINPIYIGSVGNVDMAAVPASVPAAMGAYGAGFGTSNAQVNMAINAYAYGANSFRIAQWVYNTSGGAAGMGTWGSSAANSLGNATVTAAYTFIIPISGWLP